MRHLEHAAEDKFWEAWIKDDTVLYYRFGKIGAGGQTRIKRFASRTEAEADLEENVQRKIEEGFTETGEKGDKPDKSAHAVASAPVKAAHAVAKKVKTVKPEHATGARNALEALQQGLGGRSWKVRRLGRRARHALERVHGADPAKQGFGDAFDALMQQVGAAQRRLPLELAVELLSELDPDVYVRTVKQWKDSIVGSVLAATVEAVHDADVALRVGSAFAVRNLEPSAWRKRFAHVKPELEESLKHGGSTLAKFLKSLDTGEDAVLASHVEEAAR